MQSKIDQLQRLRINQTRFQRDFETLAEIGSTGDGGVHRPALTENHLAARRWFQNRALEEGLEFAIDGAGNHSARLPGSDSQARTLLLGSHLDSVPHGGRFDGALGVVAALEVLCTVRDAGLQLPLHLEAIDFTDEEGTLVGLMGSRALSGSLTASELERPRGGREAFLEGLRGAALSEAGILSATRDASGLVGFLEIHIEQGPRLMAAAAQIGIVEALVGIGSYRLTFSGRADHAGTTPMEARRDAGLGAAGTILAATRLVGEEFPGCVINFGQIEFKPGAYNIVPERAILALEFRAPDQDVMDRLERALLEIAGQQAENAGLELTADRQGCIPPTPCAPAAQQAFRKTCEILDLTPIALHSGAGHDTQALARVCPAGMIFIPSIGGSHNPAEYATWEACFNGANVLLQAALRLALPGQGEPDMDQQ